MMQDNELFNKIFGSLVGGSIGDAFGIRVEMMHYRDIKEQYGWVTHFDDLPPRKPSTQSPLERWNPMGVQLENVDGFHPLGRWTHDVGAYTDDMRYRLMACHAMLKKGGPINGADFAETWFNYRLMVEGADEYEPTLSWPGPQKAYGRAMASLPRLTHLSSQQRACFSGWDGPMGFLHAGDPAAAAESGYAMAVAIATALTPDATIEDVVDQVLEHAWVLGNHATEFKGRLERAMEIAANCSSPFEFYEPFYKEFLVTFPPWEAVWSLEMIPAALAICVIAGKDTEQVIIGAANIGRDADTIAGIAGELAGALYGIDSLPKAWVEKVLKYNPEPDMEKMSADLTHLMSELNQAQLERSKKLLSSTK
jgi:ADP-ribosylglycohydrolase